MKVFKDGKVINADKDQIPALKEAGWSITAPVVAVEDKGADPSEGTAPKKVLVKRKPIKIGEE